MNRKDGPFTDTMFIRQTDVVMSDVPKRINRLVREWGGSLTIATCARR